MPDAYELCKDLLTYTVEQMEALGSDLPETQYVAPGLLVAYDGPQVTTNVLRVFAGQPGADDAYSPQGFSILSIEIAFVIVRDTPTLQDGVDDAILPKPSDMDANAQLVLQDVTNIGLAFTAVFNQKLMETYGMPVAFNVAPEGPEGGVVAAVGRWTQPFM